MTTRLQQVRIAARLRRTLAQRARIDAAGEAARAAWRADRVAELRRHAVARSPLYERLHRGLEAAPLEELPTVSKADVVDRFDELVTDRRLHLSHLREVVEAGDSSRRALGRYRVGASSGSSGRPGLFPFDESEWTGLIANAARARSIAGHPDVAGRLRSAKVGSPSPWHLSRQVAGTLQDPRKPSLALDASLDVSDLAEALREWRPHVLTAYPSVLVALVGEQHAGRLDLAPAQVLSGGEALTGSARDQVREAWGVEPFDQYVTTEAGFVAIECPAHEGLHVLDDHVLLEVVDSQRRPVEPGCPGDRVLLTVLGSRTLPLIRYELDDAVTLADGTCSCGRTSPRLVGVAGTPRELLRFSGRDGGQVEVHPVAITSVLDPSPVRAWQVVQETDRLRLLIVAPGAGFDSKVVCRDLRAALDAAGARPPTIVVQEVDALVRAASGKAALVVAAREISGSG